ncbi:MAG: hypothetical protein A2469_02635 [Candidatus Magasanikbacteria bacterium RIFOXYC2_FULL_40_16]|uniref:Uncharacterized protein n=3 Tax=Candidatus Magasanikiibacteriota TaxID=1752731 RepID=A0A1F6NJI8_9BACT|nr:MAG: hypothetical protein A2224_01745 [Candidatus Magasanikbacteria bacterium RIFOXYA2_FULL_40_20]OGH84137.1 MAG: hypothetical protein A2373_02785 [Candidatus Magasanikbacteria bacterium RIFOXYB1_FULL_40_15]OGH86770.1 MAG: hypothetical protein A2301_01720 [Candidatus Magasanikbacteria bacterium RIFOXYB2_FULL_40_13]OGH87141.1 MAG: hypothetical protein A2206_00585 [Candidatus Magasanikbacteria bacterium RIFOXYA1_FULL_40_8]OGH89173.1 MAG: hypothetical protein A2469_02635 [Candidatus Magasanikba
MLRKNNPAGLTREQKERITLVLVGFQSGNMTKDNTINRIAGLLSDRKTLSKERCSDLEDVFMGVGFGSDEAKELLRLVKRTHQDK